MSYQCFVPGCPANHASKYQVCEAKSSNERLRAALKGAVKLIETVEWNGFSVADRRVLEEARAALRTTDETTCSVAWQPIDPGHPPSGHVMVAFPDGWVAIADYAAGRWWRCGDPLTTAPVYWAPKPLPPQVKTGEKP